MIKLLDLFCKAGGCSVGYHRAAMEMGLDIEIVGVDIESQKNYPFRFVQSDALRYIITHGRMYTHIHASPPCQAYSVLTKALRNRGRVYADLVAPVRNLLEKANVPAVIENVMGSPVRGDIVLSGDMLGLKVIRKRKFELVNWFMMQPGRYPLRRGVCYDGEFLTSGFVGKGGKSKGGRDHQIAGSTTLEVQAAAMGIDWMTRLEMRQAIPPAYTKLIGLEFFKH